MRFVLTMLGILFISSCDGLVYMKVADESFTQISSDTEGLRYASTRDSIRIVIKAFTISSPQPPKSALMQYFIEIRNWRSSPVTYEPKQLTISDGTVLDSITQVWVANNCGNNTDRAKTFEEIEVATGECHTIMFNHRFPDSREKLTHLFLRLGRINDTESSWFQEYGELKLEIATKE